MPHPPPPAHRRPHRGAHRAGVPGAGVEAPAAPGEPRRTLAALRQRCVAVNGSGLLVTALLAAVCGDAMGTPVFGGLSAGMLLCGGQLAALLVTARWFDVMCSRHVDPYAAREAGRAG
ncbi:hypothetical protein [Streptomyces sp. JJ38]|uniref:hypothetical protein n=1 Tax=Streptomyces sp. JJ38 TaxID=2738128 RepID=UPI001C59B81A|nr:hypothetical protein [Streptomyces sp. JJ38]MBW1596087.1 hypothetical protein [Streptomyces sp. JJ38]